VRWLTRIQIGGLVVGILASIAAGLGLVLSPAQFFHAYLFAFLFWLGMALGCLALAMLHQLSGGMWGAIIIRFLEAGMMTLPLLFLLFVPVALGMYYLYPWTSPDAVARDAQLQHQYPYLNIPFFLIRAVIYFLVWISVAYLLRRWSLRRDEAASEALTDRLKIGSAVGIVVLGLTGTFAIIDWVMSLEPGWFSTIYGAMVLMGAVLGAFALVVLLVAWFDGYAPLSRVLAPQLFNDLGSLLLAFVMLWAYFGFSQFLLIYSGNLTQEIPWYVHRLQGGWEWLALAVAFFEFLFPFLFLLFRDLKRHPVWLAAVALVLVLARLIDVYWLVMPAFSPDRLTIGWLDLVTPAAIGGFWLAVFAWQLKRYPLLPAHDRRLIEEAEAEFAHERG
jgi:hypothetical protein